MSKHYDELVRLIKEISDIGHSAALLSWDQETYMPPKGAEARGRQLATLSAIAHEKLCDPKLGELIEQCQEDSSLTDAQKALVREVKKDRDKEVKLPTELVRKLTETSAKAHHIWVEARERSEFAMFAPILKELVELSKQKAEAIGYPEGGVPYDALLDNFEPGATVEKLNPIIDKVREIVVPAVAAITGAERKPKIDILKRSYPVDAQEKLGLFVMEKMGFDMQAGRLDKSVHPFTTSFDPRDVRLTTRYEEHWLPGSLFGVIHECGHGLYEQGLPVEYAGTPLGEAISLGIHESQSRFWENQIGRSLPFWKFLFPKVKELFPAALSDVSLDEFHFAINNVEPSLIRVEADEVTYNLHIVVRYEVEQLLFSGDANMEDLPNYWNSKMKEYLGIEPPNDRDGILQDIHWSFGGFGYFPTYLLGNLYAAQWMATMKKQISELEELISKGELLPILEWLRENIHKHGRMYSSAELAKMVSGEELNPEHFANYLKERYGELYGVSW